MEISRLPYEAKKITARIIITEKTYKEYMNSICEFESLEYTNDLFLRVAGKKIDFGKIKNVETSYKLGVEYLSITTSKSFFKFQVLNKPQWIEIPQEKKDKKPSNVIKMRNKASEDIDLIFQNMGKINVTSLPWR